MKAIETVYKGYRFRSRLEARWAVFFDAMGIVWQYEVEGYDLDGIWYLPDFFLPLENSPLKGAGYWLEIKASQLTIGEEEKLKRLVLHTGHNAFALAGNVGLGEYLVSKWAIKRETKEVRCAAHNEHSNIYYSGPFMWLPITKSIDRFEDALLAARQARFEHGEKPSLKVKAEKPKLRWAEYHGYYFCEAGTVMATTSGWMALPDGKTESIGEYPTVAQAQIALEELYFSKERMN